MIDEIPIEVIESARSDIEYLLNSVNSNSDIDAELVHLDLVLEDGDETVLDVSVKCIIHFGYEPRISIEFEWDYYVDNGVVKFWNHTDINTLLNELQCQIDKRRFK